MRERAACGDKVQRHGQKYREIFSSLNDVCMFKYEIVLNVNMSGLVEYCIGDVDVLYMLNNRNK